LSDLPRIEGNPFIIAGAKDGQRRADLKKPWAAVAKLAGLQGLRIHDLRHSFASVGAGASLGLPILGKLLGHSQPATTARYAHLDADPMRRAIETVVAAIAGAMAGSQNSAGYGLPDTLKRLAGRPSSNPILAAAFLDRRLKVSGGLEPPLGRRRAADGYATSSPLGCAAASVADADTPMVAVAAVIRAPLLASIAVSRRVKSLVIVSSFYAARQR
jgi:hypothetical protein